jgi:hypothetical protein
MARTAWVFLLALTTLSVGEKSASAGQFRRAAYYHAGQRPYKVVAAQFSQSGNLDLAIADYVSDQVCILLGNGDGTFKRPLCFSAPLPIAIASGDFNEDGHEDLAVVETSGTGNGLIAIFLGDGKGGFRPSASYATGVASVSVIVADFNGDGHLDVAVTNKGFSRPGSVMTFFGDGHGKLRARTTYKMSGGPFGIAAGDLNGDRSPDLVVAQDTGGSVAVLLNDGTGKFLKPVTYNAGGGEVVDVKIADLRNNGRNDLIAANGSLSAVAVLLNKGDGTFAPVKLYPTHCDVEALTLADFNLDGHLDAAVAAAIDNSAFLYGKGDGTFGSPVVIKDEIGTDGGYSIASGNFITGDQAPDLAIPIQDDGKVAILLNTK